jgi:hypothetical protein
MPAATGCYVWQHPAAEVLRAVSARWTLLRHAAVSAIEHVLLACFMLGLPDLHVTTVQSLYAQLHPIVSHAMPHAMPMALMLWLNG